jgi:hypothetical protein
VTFSSGGPVATQFGHAPIAYRGKGGIDRILSCTHHTTPADKLDWVYEATVPALLTSAPYNTASVHKAWGDIYQGKRVASGGSVWTNGLFCDPDDWDSLYFNFFQFYGAAGTERVFGRTSLNDATGTPTVVGSWTVEDRHCYHVGGGCVRMPSAFVTTNTSGKPLCVGNGGAWMSTNAAASRGPVLAAVPVPDTGTYADGTELPAVTMMRHEKFDNPAVGEDPARRDDDYAGGTYGVCQAGTSASRLFLNPTTNYSGANAQTRYSGATATITAGTGNGQTRTITYVTGSEFSVSPNWSPAPVAGDSEYVINISNNGEIAPVGGVGFWTAGDVLSQGVAWVTGTKRGVLMLTKYATGYQFYGGDGGTHYEGVELRMRCYDEDDIADAIGGDVWSIDPSSEWAFVLPTALHAGDLCNVSLDQSGRKLYISQAYGTGDWYPLVHVYQIGDSFGFLCRCRFI